MGLPSYVPESLLRDTPAKRVCLMADCIFFLDLKLESTQFETLPEFLVQRSAPSAGLGSGTADIAKQMDLVVF